MRPNAVASAGTPSGLEQLDALTCGFQPADLIIAAARPSVGKTAFALTLCVNALMLLPTQPVQIYSMEMSAEQLLLRLVSLIGHVSQTRLRSGDLSDDDWQQIGLSASILMNEWKDRLLLDDSGILTPIPATQSGQTIAAPVRASLADRG